MRIGIIGNGTVGHATARVFMEQHEVRVWDVIGTKCTHSLRDTIVCSDIVFVCLPTPQLNDSGECDLTALEYLFSGARDSQTNFVIRSTVPIGTTRKLSNKYGLPNICHSPEFLTARCAVVDAMTPSRLLIGDLCYRRNASLGSSPCGSMLWDLYHTRFPGVPVLCMDTEESEAVKLFTNAAFAVKVAFFNEINHLAQRLRLDWGTILEGMLTDGRITHSHTQVPGPDGKYGFGGACLPKDLAMLVHQMCMEDGTIQILPIKDSVTIGTCFAQSICHAALERNELDRHRT